MTRTETLARMRAVVRAKRRAAKDRRPGIPKAEPQRHPMRDRKRWD